jgi:hypothetical protein
VYAIKDIPIESFGLTPDHSWFAINDPVMGGQSTGSATVQDGIGVFQGEVKGVPTLNDAPGFIAMQTRGGYYPDLSSCSGLRLTVKSANDYAGFRVSFGTNHPSGSMPYARGYKAHFVPPVGSFGWVTIPFEKFSDYWDPKTGDQIVTCEEDNNWCPDDITLENLLRFEIMAEGVLGVVDLQVKLIEAVDCADDVSTVDQNPGLHQQGGRGQNGHFGSGELQNIDHIGYVSPHILSNGDIRIESFSNPQHAWFALNDPVMGGSSTSTVTLENDVGVFEGEVMDVSFLHAPGFIKMETRGGAFPDVSHCNSLKLNLKAPLDYDGLHVTFGVHHAAGTEPYVRGYKAPLVVKRSESFQDVVIPFTDFSDNWDALTGDVLVSCSKNPKYCPDDATLRDFTTFAIMGEGVDGKVLVEVASIDAIDCSKLSSDGNAGRSVNSGHWIGVFSGFVVVAGVGVGIGKRMGSKYSGREVVVPVPTRLRLDAGIV